MPIDKAMTHELADAWFPPFLEAQRMNASHPLREKAFEAAELAVYESYVDVADSSLPADEYAAQLDAYTDTAADVIEVLRGCAALVDQHFIERETHV